MTRRFKVMQLTADSGAAHVRFRGHWLRDAGFNPGASFTVECKGAGVIELRVDSPVQLRAEDFVAAISPLERLGL